MSIPWLTARTIGGIRGITPPARQSQQGGPYSVSFASMDRVAGAGLSGAKEAPGFQDTIVNTLRFRDSDELGHSFPGIQHRQWSEFLGGHRFDRVRVSGVQGYEQLSDRKVGNDDVCDGLRRVVG